MTPLYAQNHDYSKYSVLAVDDIPLNILLVQKMLAKFNRKIIASAVYRKIRCLACSGAYLKTTLALIKPAYLLHIIK